MNNRNYLLMLLTITLLFTACGPEPVEPDYNAPATYTFERNGETSVSFSGQTDRILMATELIDAMKDFSISSLKLKEMFRNEGENGEDVSPFADEGLNSSTKSIKSKVAASKDFFAANTTESSEKKADFESWIDAFVTEIVPEENSIASPGNAGQIADGSSIRYVNAKGLEYNQAVNKSLIGALMVDQILNNYLSTEVLDEATNITDNNSDNVVEGKNYTTMEHKWDEAFGYLFGTSVDASIPLDDLEADSFLNKYLSRVNDDADFNNYAQNIFDAFKLGRAAIVNKDYETRNQQAEILRELISKVIAIRAVYYLQAGKNAIPTDGDPNLFGTAFHDLSEGYGFVYSLRFTRKSNSQEPYFSKAEVDGFINQLTDGNGFWDVSATTLDAIAEEIASKFDFTVYQAAN